MSLDPGLLTPFAEFCEAEGVKTSKVELHLFDDDVRGVRALEALAPGDVLLRAPLHALLSVHSAASDRTLQHGLAASRQPEPEPRCLLAAHLLCQRAVPNGKWARYIATLPPTYTTLAAFPGDVVDELQVSAGALRASAMFSHSWSSPTKVTDMGMLKNMHVLCEPAFATPNSPCRYMQRSCLAMTRNSECCVAGSTGLRALCTRDGANAQRLQRHAASAARGGFAARRVQLAGVALRRGRSGHTHHASAR